MTTLEVVEDINEIGIEVFERNKKKETNPYVKHKISFKDNVPDYLQVAYRFKDFIDHDYDEFGRDKGALFNRITVNLTSERIIIKELRPFYTKKVKLIYNFNNEYEQKIFMELFKIDNINEAKKILCSVNEVGGSVLKCIIRGDNYIDKYYDKIECKPKHHHFKKALETATKFCVIFGTVITITALL